MELTPEKVRELLDYDPETGILTWRRRPIRPEEVARDKNWNARCEGKPAGCITPYGYRMLGITAEFGKEEKLLAHRIAWAHYYGEWPTGFLDHINRDRLDNSIRNLRPATITENSMNAKVRKDNSSGVRGVSRFRDGRWRVRLNKNGEEVYCAFFASKEEAIAARKEAALRFYGEFARECHD